MGGGGPDKGGSTFLPLPPPCVQSAWFPQLLMEPPAKSSEGEARFLHLKLFRNLLLYEPGGSISALLNLTEAGVTLKFSDT